MKKKSERGSRARHRFSLTRRRKGALLLLLLSLPPPPLLLSLRLRAPAACLQCSPAPQRPTRSSSNTLLPPQLLLMRRATRRSASPKIPPPLQQQLSLNSLSSLSSRSRAGSTRPCARVPHPGLWLLPGEHRGPSQVREERERASIEKHRAKKIKMNGFMSLLSPSLRVPIPLARAFPRTRRALYNVSLSLTSKE
jgi:hypothetical protein